MNKVQLIGLPGSGKSNFINNYIGKYTNVQHIDICDIKATCYSEREKIFKYQIVNSQGPLIAESACGISIPHVYVIRLDVPLRYIYERFKGRESYLDEDYLSLLSTEIIRADYVVKQQPELLEILFNNILQ